MFDKDIVIFFVKKFPLFLKLAFRYRHNYIVYTLQCTPLSAYRPITRCGLNTTSCGDRPLVSLSSSVKGGGRYDTIRGLES